VLGSHSESTGYAVLEALACGTMPIASDIPPFRALTGGGRVGALVTPGDASGFAAAIVRLAAADRARLRRQAREHFLRELSFAALGYRLVGIYHELLRQRRRPAGAAPLPAQLPGASP
ncbi:MAG TPA: glycosyltransferase, partial [Longimicrobiales bacterium]